MLVKEKPRLKETQAFEFVVKNTREPQNDADTNLDEVIITADDARRQVNRWLCNEVAMLFIARTPSLVTGDNGHSPHWRVPVFYVTPSAGEVGQLGEIDVDVKTGEMNNTQQKEDEFFSIQKAVSFSESIVRSEMVLLCLQSSGKGGFTA
ncbi:MAG: hypothetical protein AAF639_12510 [Chloroflexota bacterium]